MLLHNLTFMPEPVEKSFRQKLYHLMHLFLRLLTHIYSIYREILKKDTTTELKYIVLIIFVLILFLIDVYANFQDYIPEGWRRKFDRPSRKVMDCEMQIFTVSIQRNKPETRDLEEIAKLNAQMENIQADVISDRSPSF